MVFRWFLHTTVVSFRSEFCELNPCLTRKILLFTQKIVKLLFEYRNKSSMFDEVLKWQKHRPLLHRIFPRLFHLNIYHIIFDTIEACGISVWRFIQCSHTIIKCFHLAHPIVISHLASVCLFYALFTYQVLLFFAAHYTVHRIVHKGPFISVVSHCSIRILCNWS